MKYVFGPVLSRRLGRSLGVDPVPLKTCNWNCVYCQLGRTRPMVAERKEWVPAEDVLAELRQAVESLESGLDWITFVGSGEPTLHSRLGWMIRAAKALDAAPVAVITNGSLLHLPEVRRDLIAADALLPSLDAGSESVYRSITRPHPEATFERLVEGLIAMRHEYAGRIWVETMLVPGLNDGDAALEDLRQVLSRVAPDEIHINVAVRPPAEPWVTTPSNAVVARAALVFGRVARVVVPSGRGGVAFEEGADPLERVLEAIQRHPLPEEVLRQDLVRSFGEEETERVFASLAKSDRAQRLDRGGESCWAARDSFFPGSKLSRPLHTSKDACESPDSPDSPDNDDGGDDEGRGREHAHELTESRRGQ